MFLCADVTSLKLFFHKKKKIFKMFLISFLLGNTDSFVLVWYLFIAGSCKERREMYHFCSLMYVHFLSFHLLFFLQNLKIVVLKQIVRFAAFHHSITFGNFLNNRLCLKQFCLDLQVVLWSENVNLSVVTVPNLYCK